MIIRPPQHWFKSLFVWHGSVLPNILLRLVLNAAMAVLAIALLPWYEASGVRLTLGPFSLLGVAIAIFLAFRNNTAYARFSEARQYWGALLVTTRSLLRQVKSVLPHEADAHSFALRLAAFTWCLNHQLRGTEQRPDLQRLLPASDVASVAASPMPCNRILLDMGLWLGGKRRAGAISDVVYAGMDQNLDKLSQILGGCERIASTPIPFAYSLILQRTVYLFCTLLPFALVEDLQYMTPLVSVFISYTFLALEAVAEELEDPFGTAPNDLPLNALCTVIERHLADMAGSLSMPAPPHPDHRFNLS